MRDMPMLDRKEFKKIAAMIDPEGPTKFHPVEPRNELSDDEPELDPSELSIDHGENVAEES